MILQACVTEQSIRHAAIAIGALGKAYEITKSRPSPIDGSRMIRHTNRFPNPGNTTALQNANSFKSENVVKEAYLHHHQALEQYDKAIKRMRNDISEGNQSIRTTLIICIIIICFEAIHGNHESAAGQLQSGLGLVQDWKSRQRDSEKHPQGFSSPAPAEIEDFLIQTFGRMEIQSMSVFDPRGVEVHEVLKSEGKEVVEKMPQQFSSIEEARVYLDLVTRRLMHFNSSIHKTNCTPPSSRESTPPDPLQYQKIQDPMPSIEGKIPIENTQSLRSSRALLSEQSTLSSELTAWKEAFRPLLTYARATGGQGAISALTMTISAIANSIALRAAFFINESAYDIFLPEFKIIVDYARILLELQKAQARLAKMKDGDDDETGGSVGPVIHFAFDIGIVPPLYLVMVKCRDPRVRREALKLLEQNPRREGVWDSVAVTKLGKWVISLEEEGARKFSGQSLSSPSNVTARGMSTSPSIITARASSIASPTTTVDYDSEADNTYQSQARLASIQSTQSHERYIQGVYRQTTFTPIDAKILIPEEVRVRKTMMKFDLLARRANMKCVHMDLNSGRPIKKEAVYTW